MRTLLSLMAVSISVSAALAVPPEYRVTLLPPVPGGAGILHAPRALNDLAWVTGDYPAPNADDDFAYRTFFWRPDIGTADIGTPPGLPNVLPRDINNLGQIAGTASQTAVNAWSTAHTFRWEDGAFTLFPQFVPGRGSETGFMNDQGRIVGQANDGSFTGMKALEFVAPGTLVQLFPDTPGYNWAIDINNPGQTLTTSIEGLVRIEPDGAHTVLPTIDGRGIDPEAMNDMGDVVGSSRIIGHPESSQAAIHLSGSDGWLLRSSQGRFNVAAAINNAREVVGNTRDNTGARGNHGWRWTQSDGLIPLEDLITDPPATYGVLVVDDINNRGQIVGVVINRQTGTTHGAILTPVDISLAPPASCPADIGIAGGMPGHDGQLDNNDFIAFIDLFFSAAPAADFGRAGGLPGSDGVFDNNDFIAFIGGFFAGC